MFRKLFRKKARRGNALMEYAVPMAIILLVAGVITTVTDMNDLLRDFFLAASGHTPAAMSGTTFKTEPMGGPNLGGVGNGAGGFGGNFGKVSGG